jgi:hypothetical protein
MCSPTLNVPVLMARPNNITAVSVSVDGAAPVQLDLIENIASAVEQTFNGHFTSILLKTSIRTMLKYVPAFISARETARAIGGSLGDLAGTASLIAVQKTMEVTERPDLRCARYFPGKAWVGGITLAPGPHTVTVSYSDGYTSTYTTNAQAGKLNLLEVLHLK